jgi:hypothetical protein
MILAVQSKEIMAFKVTDKVRYKHDETSGEVLEVRDDNVETGAKYLIKWDYSRCAPDWEHGDNLILVDPAEEARVAAEIQAKIDAGTSALEEAWAAFSSAKELAYRHSSLSTFTRQDLVKLDKFEAVAENFGWSSSSLHC